ncbi:hypothetical protein IMCC3317_44510 [Kordia antarctica]|uniref:Lipoprotein n=1 Tax=Kordia antarctica TaxID=1218801 RepID=A0A7L4ZRF0_9FLAO|nr:hypothetical protein [Kordia antarctica]QHI39050.1 hypothetical protein IMCC3317_44510 [Kordia antarctica]
MKKTIYIISILCVLTSCRSGLYLVDESYVDENKKDTKTFDVANFDVYVFSICEDFTKEGEDSRLERFCDCPEIFFDVTLTKDIRKVEELYVLKHKKTDLILYFTTFSHKYIDRGERFLNKRKIYENTIILEQIEYVYIGNLDATKNKIHFQGNEKLKDVILYFDPNEFPQKLFFTEANMATSENRYSIAEKISLNNIFKQDITYSKSNYKIDYYRKKYENEPYNVNQIKVISKKGELEVVFGFKNFEQYYKMAAKRIRYSPSYESIEEGKK